MGHHDCRVRSWFRRWLEHQRRVRHTTQAKGAFGVAKCRRFCLPSIRPGSETNRSRLRSSGAAARAPRPAWKPVPARSPSAADGPVQGNACFERLVIGGIVERGDHRLGGQAVAPGVLPGALLALLGAGTGAFQRVEPVGLDLLERCHAYANPQVDGHPEIGVFSATGASIFCRLRLCGAFAPKNQVRCVSQGARVRGFGRQVFGKSE